MAYKEMKMIYDQNRPDFFAMAVSHLLDIGFNNVKEITDDQIATIKDQGWATAGFLQELVTTSREIANACKSPVELIQFCAVENVFDTAFYSGKERISWERMSEIATTAIWKIINETDDWRDEIEELDLDKTERDYFEIPECEEDDYEE